MFVRRLHFLTLLFLLSFMTPVSLSWRPWNHTLMVNTTAAAVADPLGITVSKKYEGSSDFVKLRYHMGPVLSANITVHTIWYGRWTRSQKHILRSFIGSISPESTTRSTASSQLATVEGWWRTVQLYTDQTGKNVTAHLKLGAEKSLSRYSHGKVLTRLSVQSVIRTAITGRRPLPVNPKNSLYLILTSEDVMMEDFCGQVCGFHYFTFPSIVGYTLPYAWVGNSARYCPGVCAYPFAVPAYAPANWSPGKSPNGDVGVDGMVSIVGHELAELASNPLVNAWFAGQDPSFPTEIADLCEGIYGTGGGGSYTGQLTVDSDDGSWYNLVGNGGRRFLVQWIWNPVLNYCTGPNAIDQ
ncbi:Phosphate-responsive 1 family protein [Zostera marina]|uniref:Phosphate-responsive 1 family protein n=1 Tax=Zostera marina TaxID=29655 RepID=A0A0K9Q627_ZOSMR|nr:Phosphate-responsive 1 family protein [Zostera marina]